jgi:hypothetical protein
MATWTAIHLFNKEFLMGQIKNLLTDTTDAEMQVLMDNFGFNQSKVFLLMRNGACIGVYLDMNLALYDAWVCEQSEAKSGDYAEYYVRDTDFITESAEDILDNTDPTEWAEQEQS